MHPSHRTLAHAALVASCAVFAGAAIDHLSEAPLLAVLLLAQAAAIAAVIWIVRDARRGRIENASLRTDVVDLKKEVAHLDEHVELLASRTERLTRLLEVQKAVRPPGADPEVTGELLRFPAGPRRIL